MALPKLKLFLICLLTAGIGHAQKVFEFTPTCQRAYNDMTSLRLKSGLQWVEKARAENPDNLIPDFLEDYADFFPLFFNEDPADYRKKKDAYAKRLARIEQGPASSPYRDFCRATMIIHHAAVAIKFGERWNAGWDFRKGFALMRDNCRRFPDFAPNDLLYGPLQVVAGVIPDGYKWIAGLLGIRGSLKDGLRIMRGFLESKDPSANAFYNEAVFYYCYVQYYINNQPEDALRFIREKKLDLVNNHLFAYMAANLSINNKQCEAAKTIILDRNTSSEYMRTGVWDFELGYISIRHLELEGAVKYFDRYLAGFKGKFYVKDCYQKLSWCYYLLGNKSQAEAMRAKTLALGATDTEADKQAEREAKSGVWPNTLLLRTRLLNDGGYNQEALAELAGKTSDDFSQPIEKLEFAYRLGRIYDELGHDPEAIQAYESAIRRGEHDPSYYAARAALQIGFLYEKQGRKADAIAYYKKCLAMKDHEFKDSLDQKAKAGIARCTGA